MPLSEPQLVHRAQKGDRDALGELLVNHQNRLYNVALRMVGDREDAAEVTQEAMLKIVQHIGGYDGRSQLSTWMIRITMNQAISHLRKRRLRKTISLDADGASSATASQGMTYDGHSTALRDRLPDEQEPDPHQCVEQDEMLVHLHQALNRLEDDFRSVLVLRDINEMDYRQIADVLSVPVGTVKSRLFRARLALRQEMAQAYPMLNDAQPDGRPRRNRQVADDHTDHDSATPAARPARLSQGATDA